MRVAVALTLACTLIAAPAAATEVRGAARVIDGDTLEVAGQVIRLEGIDAPEAGQTCARGTDTSTNTDWRCGAAATAALKALSRGGVTCEGTERDAYDRLIATCHTANGNLNARLVRDGWALAFRRYSHRYIPEETAAAAARAGIWASDFTAPWDHRAARWQIAAQESPRAGCPIKGNISANGRIYHTPYSRHYDRTRISPERGERWFCSEREALDAGWRAPLG